MKKVAVTDAPPMTVAELMKLLKTKNPKGYLYCQSDGNGGREMIVLDKLTAKN